MSEVVAAMGAGQDRMGVDDGLRLDARRGAEGHERRLVLHEEIDEAGKVASARNSAEPSLTALRTSPGATPVSARKRDRSSGSPASQPRMERAVASASSRAGVSFWRFILFPREIYLFINQVTLTWLRSGWAILALPQLIYLPDGCKAGERNRDARCPSRS